MHATIEEQPTREQRTSTHTLTVNEAFEQFVETELLPAAGIDSATFWSGLEAVVDELTPENRRLLARRDELQEKIDKWHLQHRGQEWDADDYSQFLRDIGYLVPTGEPFEITTRNVDDEIANVAGPQLVVPVSNARFALNAANARWGSLFDALYGSDVIDSSEGREATVGYNPVRGQAVIDYAVEFLDRTLPLRGASHADVLRYEARTIWRRAECIAILKDSRETRLKDAWQFVAYTGSDPLQSILFKNNGLHIELQLDAEHPVGRSAPGHISDILMESAVTTIQDCEDSVAAVDAEEKISVYRNWLGLMQGTLSATFNKGDQELTRELRDDRTYTTIDGGQLTLPGRSLMLVRNVGHLMQSDAVIDGDGQQIFEGILDAIITVACALADLRGHSRFRNSRSGSIYIVKPKMHGPDEAAFANKLFNRVETLFGLPANAIKIGVMDEERRTTANLQECIRAVKDRLVFINTGFLDRTGDEIHTCMQAGPMLRKEDIKSQPWIMAYEDWNVDIGIRCGLPGKAQIGKGMWPKPDEMREMMESKGAHPEAGASCAWVPSPTAATLHAMHYHDCSVAAAQQRLANREPASLEDILTPPLGDARLLSADDIQAELDNNAQGILGYVVRWIEQGIGCSKVPDIDNVGLMEDRATLRISSQHIANWLLHGVCSEQQVRDTFERMAAIVDRQNAGDSAYRPMSRDFSSSFAFNAALDLVFKGVAQPNGYTEPLLHQWRRDMKRAGEPAANT